VDVILPAYVDAEHYYDQCGENYEHGDTEPESRAVLGAFELAPSEDSKAISPRST
jgi:hypothetical protein